MLRTRHQQIRPLCRCPQGRRPKSWRTPDHEEIWKARFNHGPKHVQIETQNIVSRYISHIGPFLLYIQYIPTRDCTILNNMQCTTYIHTYIYIIKFLSDVFCFAKELCVATKGFWMGSYTWATPYQSPKWLEASCKSWSQVHICNSRQKKTAWHLNTVHSCEILPGPATHPPNATRKVLPSYKHLPWRMRIPAGLAGSFAESEDSFSIWHSCSKNRLTNKPILLPLPSGCTSTSYQRCTSDHVAALRWHLLRTFIRN